MHDLNKEKVSRRETLRIAMLGSLATVVGASNVLEGSLVGTAAAAIGSTSFAPPPGGAAGNMNGWEDYEKVLANIKAPTFPARDFSITQHGAVADGKSDATGAIAKAIAACSQAGGGRVVVPAGEFLTGPIVLKSNINLHLSEGAVLKFFTDPAKYPLVFTRWEGIECMNFSPLIYAFEQENIAVTGKGTLDGQAAKENWWDWKLSHWNNPAEDKQRPDARALIAMGEKGVPVEERIFGLGQGCARISSSLTAAGTFWWRMSPLSARRCGRYTPCCLPTLPYGASPFPHMGPITMVVIRNPPRMS